jgi:hypothetical protein
MQVTLKSVHKINGVALLLVSVLWLTFGMQPAVANNGTNPNNTTGNTGTQVSDACQNALNQQSNDFLAFSGAGLAAGAGILIGGAGGGAVAGAGGLSFIGMWRQLMNDQHAVNQNCSQYGIGTGTS